MCLERKGKQKWICTESWDVLKNYNERIDKSVKFHFCTQQGSYRNICRRVKIEKVFCKLQSWDIKFATSRDTFCDFQFDRKPSNLLASRNQPIWSRSSWQCTTLHEASLPTRIFEHVSMIYRCLGWVNCWTWTKCEFKPDLVISSQFVRKVLLGLSKIRLNAI